MRKHSQINIRSPLLLTLCALIWGMAFVAQRAGMDFIGPFLFMGIRMLLGSVTMLIVIVIQGFLRPIPAIDRQVQQPQLTNAQKKMDIRRLMKAGAFCGLVLFFGGSLQQVGLVFTTASKAGFLTALYLVLVPIFGIVLKHKTHWNTWASVLIAMVGLYFLCITDGFSIEFGDLITLCGALFWAGHILVIDHFVTGLSQRDVMKLCAAQFMVASVLGFISSAFLDRLFINGVFETAAIIGALPSILYVGILSTGVAFTLQAMGQQGISPSAASIIMSLEAVFSVVGGMLILGEVLSGQEVFGCVLMFSAFILSQLPIGQSKQPI